ncbi:hypothetical protein ACHAWF_018082 [Thalassiosira exigua]
MADYGIDVMGLSETKRPWTAQNKWEFNWMMKSRFGQHWTEFSSAPSHYDQKYQPGGNALTIVGNLVGRRKDSGADELGRYCWYTLRGKRDEGICFISAYRVCQSSPGQAGATSAYMQQYSHLRRSGKSKPNPRRQILQDLLGLIQEKRAEGFRPVLMLDANGDYLAEKDPDVELEQFLVDANLIDPYKDKFGSSTRTYLHGSKRLDFIFIDPALASAVKRIGYLGIHDGPYSDHVMAYVDFDEKTLFKGIIHRPVSVHSREFLIAQSDKVKGFLETLIPELHSHKIRAKAGELITLFASDGLTRANETRYHKVAADLHRIIMATVAKVGKKKYGYMRSPELGLQGKIVTTFKQFLDSKERRCPPSDALYSKAEQMGMDIEHLATMSIKELRREVRRQRMELWEVQKQAESKRHQWLEEVAKDRARAEGDPDWERKLKDMARVAKDSAMHRKVTAITKGRRGVLDRVQVPTHDWYYSPQWNEILHYDRGSFEAYPSAGDGTFFRHHTLKVIPKDAECIEVTIDGATDRWKITRRVPPPNVLWRDVTSQAEMENLILERNKRHLQQMAIEDGPSESEPLLSMRDNYGFNKMTKDILDGVFTTEHEVSPALAAWIKALCQTNKERAVPPVLGGVSTDTWQRLFRSSNERTSSEPNGMNYTILKALAMSRYVSEIMAIMASLPFIYGFVNKRWLTETDFVIEKKPGDCRMHRLRIIGKLDAEWNTLLKHYGREAMKNFEAGDPSDEQWGFRKDRTAIDAAMIKLLTYEVSRMAVLVIGDTQYDNSQCFDRIWPENSNIGLQRMNVQEELAISRAKAIEKMVRRFQTALGISEGYYRQEPGEHRIGGEIQGKGDVPPCYVILGDTILKAHQQMVKGLSIPSPSGQRRMERHNVSYADDNNSHVSADLHSPDPVMEVAYMLQESAQAWNDLTALSGGLIALHKCSWNLMSYKFVDGQPQLVDEIDHRLVIEDGKGATAEIEYKRPNEPNEGLGVMLCPNGSQDPQFKDILSKSKKVCSASASSFMTEAEAHHAMKGRLAPKLSYPMTISNLTKRQCKTLNTLHRKTFLPMMRLNRNTPNAVIFGPIEMGGMELPEAEALQSQSLVPYVIRSLRHDKTVAKDFLTTLDWVQLKSGFVRPILEDVQVRLDYVGRSLMVFLRNILRDIDSSLWIEDAWTPRLQRVGDESLMERFATHPRATKGQLEKLNAVRLYMRVVTVADLADPTGRFIPDGMLTGEWQAGTDLQWPTQDLPPKRHWALFRKYLRETFCRGTSAHQPVRYGMALTTPLGDWLPVPRNTWFQCYRTRTDLYWRDDEGSLHRMKRTKAHAFYRRVERVEELPLDSHPIHYRQFSETIWTRAGYKMRETGSIEPPAGHIISSTIFDPANERVEISSDGSCHLHRQIAGAAWLIESGEAKEEACILLHDQTTSCTGFRSESEGIFRSLHHLHQLGVHPQEVVQWCDNEYAVESSNRPPKTPREVMASEADVIMAIHDLKSRLPFPVVRRHVYGHQDTRGQRHKAKPKAKRRRILIEDEREVDLLTSESEATSSSSEDSSTTATQGPRNPYVKPRKPPPREVRNNIRCDEMASDTTAIAVEGGIDSLPTMPPTLSPPYRGSRAMLKIAGRWVTSKYKKHIYNAHRRGPMVAYMKGQYGWTDAEIKAIHWDSIGRVRSKMSIKWIRQTSKIMHGWLPTMHMRHHITKINQCPGCNCQDETIDHILRCPNPHMKRKREEVIEQLRKKGLADKIPKRIVEAVAKTITKYFNGEENYILPHYELEIKAAIWRQEQLGMKFFLRGYIAREWEDAIASTGSTKPHRKLDKLLSLIWKEVTEPLWLQRCELLHKTQNKYKMAEDDRLSALILWYIQHKRDVLSIYDQALAPLDAATVYRMRPIQRREWIRHLDTAKAAYDKEQFQLERNQPVITRYLERKDKREQATLPPILVEQCA